MKAFAVPGVLPRVRFTREDAALPAADALLAGQIAAMEIEAAGAGSAAIRAIRCGRPEMAVGALAACAEECAAALEAGAQFITMPFFDEGLLRLCAQRGADAIPVCAGASEIEAARALGAAAVMTSFPDPDTGIRTLREYFDRFGDLRFIPLGIGDGDELGLYTASPAVSCVSAEWVAPPDAVAAGDWERITENCRRARQAVLGFRLGHVGINCPDEAAARELAARFGEVFGFPNAEKVSNSIYATDFIEVMKLMQHGTHGHLAICSNSVERAAAEMEKKGLHLRPETAKYALGRMRVVYLLEEFGGFAIHLIQREV